MVTNISADHFGEYGIHDLDDLAEVKLTVASALAPDSRGALSDAIDHAEADPDVWAVVLTGAGDQAFSAGADLKALATGRGGKGDLHRPGGGFAGITRRRFPKPLLAAVNGAALAGGLEMVLACDFADHGGARHLRPSRRSSGGSSPAPGACLHLPNRLPLSVALELAMTGERIDAHQALGFGLVNRVVPTGTALEATVAVKVICADAPLAVRASKRVALAAAELRDELWDLNDATVHEVMRSEDTREGPTAFAEKRPPRAGPGGDAQSSSSWWARCDRVDHLVDHLEDHLARRTHGVEPADHLTHGHARQLRGPEPRLRSAPWPAWPASSATATGGASALLGVPRLGPCVAELPNRLAGDGSGSNRVAGPRRQELVPHHRGSDLLHGQPDRTGPHALRTHRQRRRD